MRLNNLYALICFLIISAAPTTSFSQHLPQDSAEAKQLIAMGYDVAKVETGDIFTVASNGSTKVAVAKSAERTVAVRYFTRDKKLDSKQEYELLKIVNQINIDLSFQVSVADTYLAVALYEYGPYDPKVFSKLIRLIERADSIFDSYPKIRELLN